MSKLFQNIIEQTLISCDIEGKNAEVLKRELESNFLDHKDHLVSQGMNPQKAEKVVVKKFGNPTVIGKMFHKYTILKNLKKAQLLARIIAAISIIVGFNYAFRATMFEIRGWGILSIVAAISAYLASNLIYHSKVWQIRAIFGFFFLALGQILPMWGGLDIFGRRYGYCTDTPTLSVVCTRAAELFTGLGIHLLLFVLCLLAIYAILAPNKKEQILD